MAAHLFPILIALLVHCTDGDVAKVMEDVTMVTVTTTESVNAVECRDAPDVDCLLYSSTKICDKDSIYYPWAKVRCPFYCGFCQRPTLTILCKDEIPNCEDYSRDLCTNPLYRIFREKNCRKSCKICTDFDSVPNTDSLVG
ncbi:uncharacterized protein ZK673.1-like [Crassostrea angulata]|uniref:uncharacterized protein ZK673.1-like n=1 Tax=Magallana angulata TaxID=2784310 RepID=UPI0022B10554|nr:uncharacterized protein ZK673.1-like [Crassostrea angulata]